MTSTLSYGPFITRAQAQDQGIKQFFTGKPCKYGHVDSRKVCDRRCCACARIRSLAAHYQKQSDPAYRARKVQNAGKWRKNNPELSRKHIIQQTLNRENNPQTRFANRLRVLVNASLRKQNGSKAHRTTSMIGCTVKELVRHLESQFLPGMTWENHTQDGWHIDHVRPCASFDLTDPEQQKQCFHYTNLQPLWAVDNMSKGDKWEAA